ncbi:MAG: ABC transporter permease [Marivibrio sp.]|uniref:ABC transporter permease n=1 Tax=Marivibrio sp. TaxID=2039719 RepID=UPI0032ED0938
MLAYAAHRLLQFVGTLVAASLIVFLALEVLPGDAAQILLGTEANAETLKALREQLGLDRPAVARYGGWIGGLLTGDLGTSHIYGVPIADMLAERIALSAPLALLAFALSTVLALPLGVFAATRRGSAGDWAVIGFAQIGLAVPNFWFGILLILVFAVQWGLFSSGGFPGWEAGIGPAIKALILPAVALALSEAAILARVARSAMLETLGEDYIRTARAKGLSERRVLFGHALRNAMIPVATIMGLQFAFLVMGAVIVENVFYLPGLGRLLLQSIFQRDLVVVRDLVLLLSGFVILVNLLVDLAYAAIDPRPRTAAAGGDAR